MIRFLSDWKRYPNAIVHTKTSNKSFLRMAEIFKKMGVKNYFFHLALMNPALEDVDPFSDDLTADQMTMIQIECKYNPWYFFREILRFPSSGSPVPDRFKANRGNLAAIWLFLCHIDYILIQPRQTGKSVTADGILIYIVMLAGYKTDVNLITKDDTLRKKNIARAKEMISLLPAYLNYTTKDDADNKEEITCKKLRNHYLSGIAQNNPISANNIGRGLTSAVKQIDEGPFGNFMDISVPALLGSGNAARDQAKANGGFYGNIFTTTAGKKDTRSGRYFYDLLMGGLIWTEALYDRKDQVELESYVNANSPGFKKIVNCTFSHRQLGFTDEYMIRVMRDNNLQGEDADRDAFNRWTSGGLTSPLNVAITEAMRDSERDPVWIENTDHHYMINWYLSPDEIRERGKTRKFIVGCDSSDAVGNDSITMVMMDSWTLETVATMAINETNLIRFSGFLADFMIKHPYTVLIPERKSSWVAIIDTLTIRLPAVGIDPFRRIYNRVGDNPYEYEREFREISGNINRRDDYFYDRFKKYFGFNTSGSGEHSRSNLYKDILQLAARHAGGSLYDRRLINEVTGLETKNGRVDHSQGKHDDMVIAWLMVVWMLSSSKNLRFYGIESPMCATREIGKEIKVKTDPYEIYLEQEQEVIKDQIRGYVESLRNTNDPLTATHFETLIQHLGSRLRDDIEDGVTIDSLIKEAKESKKTKRPVATDSEPVQSTTIDGRKRYSNMLNRGRKVDVVEY